MDAKMQKRIGSYQHGRGLERHVEFDWCMIVLTTDADDMRLL